MTNRIQFALAKAVSNGQRGAPPKLAAAIYDSVFPGGARIRPRLCLAVAEACGDDSPLLSDAVAAAIELLHCASLVHDDLPCFDDADFRRGLPTVHRKHGEALAVLAGDGLIVMAFDVVARASAFRPERLADLVVTLARAVGTPHGLVAGQGWESEESPPLAVYHRAKTGSLFTAATMAGAIAAGRDPAAWEAMGLRLGEAYQVADDLLDALGSPEEAGKPTRCDVALGRPNAVASLGVSGAVDRLRQLVAEAGDAVPECPGAVALRDLTSELAERLIPKSLKQTAA